MSSINGIRNVQRYINRTGQDLGRNFQKEIINRTRILSKNLQTGMTNSVDRGAVPFTNRAVIFTYQKTSTGVTCEIFVKKLQAKYLYNVLVKEENVRKFVPTSSARLTKQGNISGLYTNLKKGRYKIVRQGNKERLIDMNVKNKKNNKKRVIGLREDKRRKVIYDFYKEANTGACLVISGIKGTLRIKSR